jgi:hypothetical protein
MPAFSLFLADQALTHIVAVPVGSDLVKDEVSSTVSAQESGAVWHYHQKLARRESQEGSGNLLGKLILSESFKKRLLVFF